MYANDIGLANTNPEVMGHSMAFLSNRLINTRGSLIIETPPGRAEGPIWDICKKMVKEGPNGYARVSPKPRMSERGCWVRSLPSRLAVKAGIINQSDLDLLSEDRYAPVYYECAFDRKGTPDASVEYAEGIMKMMGA